MGLLALGLTGLVAFARPPRAPGDHAALQARATVPDLDIVRYRDPEVRREIWVGADVGGVVVPASVGLFDRTMWTVHGTPAWAFALTDWLTLGGRHTMALYDADNIRLREHDHQVELSARTLSLRGPGRQLTDRAAIGVSTHAIKKTTIDEIEVKPGGLSDTILHAAYGMSHTLGRRVRLGWRLQGRHAWVLKHTQRQVRAAVRASIFVRRRHRLAVEAIGYYVNREADQGTGRLPRNGVSGQWTAEWIWMAPAGIGPLVRARFMSAFRTGEAPIYEFREEALDTVYGELIVGMRAIWR